MKDPQKELRAAYYQQLKTALSGVEVYDMVADDDASGDRYVILSTITDTQTPNKHAHIVDCTVLVDVVTKSVNSTGRDVCDDLAALIVQSITTANLSLPSFQLVTTTRIGNDSGKSFSGANHIYRRLIRYRHTVAEK